MHISLSVDMGSAASPDRDDRVTLPELGARQSPPLGSELAQNLRFPLLGTPVMPSRARKYRDCSHCIGSVIRVEMVLQAILSSHTKRRIVQSMPWNLEML